MEPEDTAREPRDEAMMGAFTADSPRRRPERQISHARRLELQKFASNIAAEVFKKTKQHERCLLRRMVENLMPGED